jgi:glutamine synthetase
MTHESPINGTYLYVIEYIWLGGSDEFRSKVKCIRNNKKFLIIDDIGIWNYDGSSTGQAITSNSEIILKPVQLYKDKSNENYYYVLCETFRYENEKLVPLVNNYRNKLKELENKYDSPIYDNDFWFGFEQEFFIWDSIKDKSIGFNEKIPEQGPYYCNIELIKSSNKEYDIYNINETRKYTELIFNKCLDLDLGVTGWNLEVAPGQTEIQVFGNYIKACDDLMMLRFLCHKVLSEYNLLPNFHPKPLGSKWNGSGLHTNISTKYTREENGYEIIKKYMNYFENKHRNHILEYGNENHLRLTGIHETSSLDKFSYGIASRSSSIRIPRETYINNRGYFEDRRPCAWADPYKIASIIIDTILDN